MVHKSLDIAQPGDVVVVDDQRFGADRRRSATSSRTKARHRGIAGFIVDGLIRDLPAIRALGDFPVFARGVTPTGPLHRGPGEINHPISCGGIVVNPGDVVVGDLNGVVVVPRGIAEELLERLIAQTASEADYIAASPAATSRTTGSTLLDESGIEIESGGPVAS